MDSACSWLLQALKNPGASSLKTIQARHRARDDDFDLGDVLAFIPSKQHQVLATSLRAAFAPSLLKLKEAIADGLTAEGLDDDAVLPDDVSAIRTAAEIVWLFVHERKEPALPDLGNIIIDLHTVLLALPRVQAQNQVAKICEWMWQVGDVQRDYIVPQTMLFLLLRSFGGETEQFTENGKLVRSGGTAADVNRVYAMRQALEALELSEEVPDSETIRNLLFRCATSALYLRVDNGQKFLAYLLTVEDVRGSILAAVLNQVGHIQKRRAPLYGKVFLLAWKLERSSWLCQTLMNIAEKAIYAGTEPFATNMRSILSAFHSNKRIPGVDAILNRVYGPVLYRNLMVANPQVRKNAVMILSDAFPIHDPGSKLQDIEESIGFQCGKLLHLLEDPAPIVRKAAVEGSSRILGLLWELVPLASAQRIIDMMTSKLAFDATSSQVRVAVLEGLQFLTRNHLAHQILAIALPRLGCLIHDNVERVRLSFLDLLLAVKEKRIRVVRYFDIVPLNDLLLRLPIESPAAAIKIMNLLLSSYFPLERKGKTAEEVASSQVRACLAMIQKNKDAASYFYKNVNLFVPPGPLCEFAMRLSGIALEQSPPTDDDAITTHVSARGSKKGRKGKRRPRRKTNDENQSGNVSMDVNTADGQKREQPGSPDPISLLVVVASVLSSISPSLEKQANKQLRQYVDEIFGGDALVSLLVEKGNSVSFRAVCWAIGSSVSSSEVGSLRVLWREQLDSVLEWPRDTEAERDRYLMLLSSLLLCGLRWQFLNPIGAVISGWADAAVSGHRTSMLGTKLSRKSGRRSIKTKSCSNERASTKDEFTCTTRVNALFALRSCAAIIVDDGEFRQALFDAFPLATSPASSGTSGLSSTDLLQSIRKGCLGAFDSLLESWNGGASPEEVPQAHVLLDAVSNIWKASIICLADARCGTGMAQEAIEMLHWAAGSELLKNASRVGPEFSLALACLNLSHVADIIALGYLDEGEIQLIERMVEEVRRNVDMSDCRKLTRPAAELLRISYQLLQRASLDLTPCDDDKHPSRLVVTKTVATVVATVCQMLGSCEFRYQITGKPTKLSVLDVFISDVMVSLSLIEDRSAFGVDIGQQLSHAFQNADEGKQNLLAHTICNVLASLVTSKSGRNSSALTVYETVLSFIRSDENAALSREATANLTCSLVKSISSFFEEEQALPNEEVRHFLASLEVGFHEEFGLDIGLLNSDEAMGETISDIRKVLADLQKICLPQQNSPAKVLEESPRNQSIDARKETPARVVEAEPSVIGVLQKVSDSEEVECDENVS